MANELLTKVVLTPSVGTIVYTAQSADVNLTTDIDITILNTSNFPAIIDVASMPAGQTEPVAIDYIEKNYAIKPRDDSYQRSNFTLSAGEQLYIISDTAVVVRVEKSPEGGSSGAVTSQVSVNADAGIGSLTEVAPATDTASSALNGRLQRIAQNLTTLKAVFPAALTAGGNLKAAILEALPAGTNILGKTGIDQTTPGTTDSVTVKASAGIGSLTEAAPATDTASSGLNGRLQRIAQNVTALKALLPTALTAGGNLKTAILEALPAGTNLLGKIGIDQTTPGVTDSVSVKGFGISYKLTITRPNDNTAYSANDVLGDSGLGSAIFEIPNLGVANGSFLIDSISLIIPAGAIPSGMTSFKVYLFSEAPAAAIDNDTLNLATDADKYQDKLFLTAPVVNSGLLESLNPGQSFQVKLSSTGSLFLKLTTDTGFTPVPSQIHYLNIHGTKV